MASDANEPLIAATGLFGAALIYGDGAITPAISVLSAIEGLNIVAPDFWRVTAYYGFMERPDIPALLPRIRARGCNIDPDSITYYIGREIIIGREDANWLSRVRTGLFILPGCRPYPAPYLQRNSYDAWRSTTDVLAEAIMKADKMPAFVGFDL